MFLYFKENSVYCYTCGKQFLPAGKPTELGYVYCTCGNAECNRGTVASTVPRPGYPVPIKVQDTEK